MAACLLLPSPAHAQPGGQAQSVGPRDAMADVGTSPSLALARYLAEIKKPDPFTESGPVGLAIEASLPDLYKEASVLAMRCPTEDKQSQYLVLQVEGDGAVVQEVISRYSTMHDEMNSPGPPSLTINPITYKFRLVGEVKTGGGLAYIYAIAPKKTRPGMIVGQLWIDSASGREVMLRGRIANNSTIGKRGVIVRETKLLNGSAYERTTHLAFAVPLLGQAELVIIESALERKNGAPQGHALGVGPALEIP